jgi:hypothetical protein
VLLAQAPQGARDRPDREQAAQQDQQRAPHDQDLFGGRDLVAEDERVFP